MPPGVEGNSPGVISDFGPGAALEAKAGAQQDPEQWDQDEDEAEEMADFPEAHRYSRGTASGAEADAQGRGGTRTSDTATAEEDATHRAGGVGERERPTFAGSTLDHQSHAESQGNRTGHAFATSMRAHPNRGKFLKFCFHCCLALLPCMPRETLADLL